MTIQAVNELIASLESAGELSIREQKFLKLAKAYLDVAAENVALKAEQVRIFNSGYLRGHESTVEGYYVDIHQDDITTYHEDIVAEISEEQTPATDRIVAAIKADGRAEGINFAASRLAAAFNHGFVDKPMAEVGDVVRMILTAKEDLANDPVLASDGLSGEYAEKSLAEWEAELREGADK
ncbi:hypothetical protein [Klebsiella variicola]|uniref:hypothetical protein n=1 Tax=Klebsiella variicola TaxID=244366 RepID=UPI0010353F3C|nr:hypothetical protein [Klebsiella variicola]